MRQFRKCIALGMSIAMIAGLCACSSGSDDSDTSTKATGGSDSTAATTVGEKEDVKLTVWGAEDDQTMLQSMIDSFKEKYADQANFDIALGVESESTCKDTVLTDVEAAADVYAFADDQLNELVAAGALQEVLLNTEDIIAANGGTDTGTVQAAMSGDKLYAYPMTADNGYFMFYNSEYFTEDDVTSLDKMMEVAAKAGKKVYMQVDDGWYLYSFFKGAGLSLGLNDDGLTTFCDWNSTSGDYKGTDVAQAVMDIAANEGFVSLTDDEFVTGVKDGSIIAGVSGTWNAQTASDTWGENYAATKLPTYTCAGDQVQMSSFAGYKLIGVNAYSDYTKWAMMLAEWLTNYDNQVIRFEQRGLGPSNVDAAASEEVLASPAIAALSAQAAYATVQRVGGNYWDPAKTFGAILKAGNTDGTDLQTLLDNLVEGVTAPVE